MNNNLLIGIIISLTIIIAFIARLIFKKDNSIKHLEAQIVKLNSEYKLIQDQNKRVELKNSLLLKENVKLESENSILQEKNARSMLQPHTMINMFSSVLALSRRLHNGAESIANIIEYVLQSHADLVSIEEELTYIINYIDYKKQVEDHYFNIKTDFQFIDRNSIYYQNKCIPHLITAYFLENSFKHGNTKHKDFLSIYVSLQNDTFIFHVKNKYIEGGEKSMRGIGLKNMEKRLELYLPNKYNIRHFSFYDEYLSELTINLKI